MFDSTATNQIYETRDAMFAKDFERVNYTYRLRAQCAANMLLVTIQSSPLIPDGSWLCTSDGLVRFGLKVVGESCAFNH